MVRRPSFTALKALEALVRCGSIHRAADDLNLSPGAISQQVRILETDLEIILFDRSARSMKPSQDALEFAEEISAAFGKIDQAIGRLTMLANTVHLKIATLPSVATRIVLPKLNEFKSQMPEVQLSFSYIHRIEDINCRDADILIGVVENEFTGERQARELFSGAVRPFATANYLKLNGPFRSTSDIAKAKLLHDFSTKPWQSWFEGVELDSSVAIEGDVFEDFELLIHATLADQGVALCPPPLISKELQTGQLLPVFDFSVLENRKYILVQPEQAKEEAMLFAEWLFQLTADL